MHLTAFADYSLRVLMYLAARPGRRATIGEIADSFGVSGHHLKKVVHFLGKAGWLANVRGRGGGLELAKAASDIHVGDVVRRTEGRPVVECFGSGGGGCAIAPCCLLADVLSQAVAAFHAVLDRHTLADITANREVLAAVLTFSPAADRAGRPASRAAARDRTAASRA